MSHPPASHFASAGARAVVRKTPRSPVTSRSGKDKHAARAWGGWASDRESELSQTTLLARCGKCSKQQRSCWPGAEYEANL